MWPIRINMKLLLVAFMLGVLGTAVACDSFQELTVTNNSGRTINLVSATYDTGTSVPPVGTHYSNSSWDVENLLPGASARFSAWSKNDHVVRDQDHRFTVVDSVSKVSIAILEFSFDELKDSDWHVVVE